MRKTNINLAAAAAVAVSTEVAEAVKPQINELPYDAAVTPSNQMNGECVLNAGKLTLHGRRNVLAHASAIAKRIRIHARPRNGGGQHPSWCGIPATADLLR